MSWWSNFQLRNWISYAPPPLPTQPADKEPSRWDKITAARAEEDRKWAETWECATYCTFCRRELVHKRTVVSWDICTGEEDKVSEFKTCPEHTRIMEEWEKMPADCNKPRRPAGWRDHIALPRKKPEYMYEARYL